MVEFLNQRSIHLDFEEEPNVKMPVLVKKARTQFEVPHYPNVDEPMSDLDIEKYSKKYPSLSASLKSSTRSEGSEQVKLRQSKNMKYKEVQDIDQDQYQDNPNGSICGDEFALEERTNNYTSGYAYHRLGNCYSFCADRKGNPMIIIGPRWYNYFLLALLINGLVWFYIFWYGSEYSKGFKIFGVILVEMFQWIFTYIFLSNPGFPKNDTGRLKGLPKHMYKYCSECQFYIDLNKKVKHCFNCGLCIEGVKRHSFILSKCIGRKNWLWYYIFLGVLGANFIYIIACFSIANS